LQTARRDVLRDSGDTMKTIRVGISGWTYPPWRGPFFPKQWPQNANSNSPLAR
jgi:hypothetical protein